MLAKVIEPQTDFSAGELNPDAKRTDDPLVKSGARQMSNWRILNTRKLNNRPGKTALFPTDGRCDEVLVAPDVIFRLCFGDGTLKIRDQDGNYIPGVGATGYAWTHATAKQIVWTLVNRSSTERDIVMCFPGQIPKIARWSSVDGWSFLDFAFAQDSYGAFQEPFYRLAPPGVTLTPSDTAGTITVQTSVDYFTSTMVGTVIRWLGQQILLTVFTNTKSMTGIVINNLPLTISFPVTLLSGTFNVGDAIGSTTAPRTDLEGEVASVTLTAGVITNMTINMFVSGRKFVTGDDMVGPNGTCNAGTVTVVSPGASAQWDEEAMNANRGWPNSCFFDQNRLGFCDLPAVPGGIAWSAIGVYDNFLIGANPANAMFEIAPNRARVFYVANRSDEFVLTDNGIWYIPISASNPLKPGSVQFLKVSSDSAAQVAPAETIEGIVFVSAGLNRIVAIVPKYGYLNIPWGTIETSLYHSHLFKTPIALAVTTSDGNFQERYVYALNSDGTLAVGKFDVSREWAGWLPWNGIGFVNWVSARAASVIFTTTYTVDSVPVTIAEMLDGEQYIDGAISINSPPIGMRAGTEPAIQALATGTPGTTLAGSAQWAFDGNPVKNVSQCIRSIPSATGFGNLVWLQSGVGSQILRRIRITAPLDQPLSAAGSTTIHVVGSNNGTAWTTLLSVTTVGTNREQYDLKHADGLDISTAYLYWGIDISGTSGQIVAVAQVEPFYNAPGETHAAPNGGTGPMWWLAGGQAMVMDGVQNYALHNIDASGNIEPIDAEDLSSATMVAGLPWSATLEPFIPQVAGGSDQGQRIRRRRIAKAVVSVQNSSGFTFGNSRVASWFTGENQEQPPPIRENSYAFRPRGRSYDPRIALVKDTPGPLTVLELGMEMTV